MNVIIIENQPLTRLTRAPKLIRSLSKMGYVVNFLGWDHGKTLTRPPNKLQELSSEILLKIKPPL